MIYIHGRRCYSSLVLDQWMYQMDIFDAVALVWLVSVTLVTVVGYFCGRTAEALDMGIFLGPVGLLLAILAISRGRKRLNEGAPIVRIADANRSLPATALSETNLRRAA